MGRSRVPLDEFERAGVEAAEARSAAKIDAVRRDLATSRRLVRDQAAELDRLRQELGLSTGLRALKPNPARWEQPAAARRRGHVGTICTILSDTHFDEVVRPDEIHGLNAYDRAIATTRLRAYFDGLIKVPSAYMAGVAYDGLVLMLGGDIFSGEIHEELTQTNADGILGSVLYWSEQLISGIAMMADHYGRVHVPVVVGNHGRRSRKPRAKFRARDNFDWFVGKLLERHFAQDRRVSFDVGESADCRVPVYGRTIVLSHGDQVKGGAGIGGIWPPIMRLDARKRERAQSVKMGHDMLVVGHWHQLVFGQSFIVNGSLKGLDEYAFQGNFGYEPPQQAMWLETPEHGRTFTAPVFVQDRAAEGW